MEATELSKGDEVETWDLEKLNGMGGNEDMREATCSGQIQRVQDSQISLRFLRLDDASAAE